MTNGTIDTAEERRNVEAVRRAYEGYKRGDPQPFFDLCAPDVRFGIAAAPEHFGFAGVRSGLDWVKHVLGEIAKEFAWESYETRELIAEGEWIIALNGGRIRERMSGDMLEADLVDVIRMKNGKVVYFIEYFDSRLLHGRDTAQARVKAVAAKAKKPAAKVKSRAKAKPAPKRAAAKAKPKSKAKAAPRRAPAKPKRAKASTRRR